MKIGILTKQFLILTFASLLAITAVVVVAVNTGFDVLSKSAQDELLREAILFSTAIGDTVQPQQLDSLAKALGKRAGIRFTVIAQDGSVLADTEKDPATMENHADRPEIIDALDSGNGSSIRYSKTTKQFRVYSATIHRAVIAGGQDFEPILVVRASMVLDKISLLNKSLARRIIPWAALLLMVMVVVTYLSKKLIDRRIERISEMASKIADGEFSTRIKVRLSDEFAPLEYSINRMAGNLKKMFDEVHHQKQELLVILETLADGVLVLDDGNHIVLMNEAAEKIVGIEFAAVEGKDALGILKIPELRKIIQNENIEQIEYQQSDSHFQAEFFVIPALNQRLIVIRDITEHYRIQQTKTDFVTNVSHELCTPLSLIKGFAETLENEPLTENQRKYVAIIMRHTDRMIALVKDLLTLSRIEQAEKIIAEKIEPAELVQEILPLFIPKAKENELTIEFIASDSIPNISGDRSLLEIAICNLIDNAIKYNKRGGKITIELSAKDNNIALSVADTGIGIPESELEHIFERFYTIDKARSHAVGGTGLGLAIVKHIVLLHKGEIFVESTAGKGSKFTINLPSL